MNLNKSFLPQNRVKCVIVDSNAPTQLFDYLNKNNINCIKTLPLNNTISAVSTHPDMQICYVGNGNYVCEPTIYEYYKNKLEIYGANVTKGNVSIKSNYPYDIAYNVVITGNFMLHNLKYTDSKIMDIANESGIGIYSTKQGYTKCATCVINDNGIITSDKGVYKNCVSYGINSLLVDSDEIILGNRKDGFLGGCCGMIDSNKLLFCGRIENHKSYNSIKNFADTFSVGLISAWDGPLTDIGSIIPVIQE